MASVGAYEAKTHLPQLIEKVLQGETVEITRHGVPVARLVPMHKTEEPGRVVEALRRLRRGKRLGGVSAKELIEDGRS